MMLSKNLNQYQDYAKLETFKKIPVSSPLADARMFYLNVFPEYGTAHNSAVFL